MTTIIVIALIGLAVLVGLIGSTWLHKQENDKVYRVNFRSKEIHRLDSTHSQCCLDGIKNYVDIQETDLQYYLDCGYNGCRHCMKEIDTDIYNKKKSEPC
jgi:hypothetical protein